MRVIKQLVSLALLVMVGLFFGPKVGAAQAPSGHSITLTPAFVNKVVQPGSTMTDTLSLLSQGETFSYSIYAAPYGVVDEAYDPSFAPLPGSVNAASWFHITPTNGDLSLRSSTLIHYTITVPAQVQPGGYYAALFVQTKPKIASQAKNHIQINQRLGELLYLQVAGPVKQTGAVASWRAGFLQTSPIVATLRLENSGGVHFFSDIKLSFQDVLGRTKFSWNAQKIILPHTIRRIVVAWPHSPAIGLFKVKGSATIFNKTVSLPSRYVLVISSTARLVIVSGVGILLLVALLIGSIMHSMRQRRGVAYKKSRHV